MRKESTHFNCLTTEISEDRKEALARKNEFQCGPCRVYPKEIVIDSNEVTTVDTIDNIKMNFLLPEFALPANVIVGPKPNECVVYESESISSKCDKCDYTNTDKNSVPMNLYAQNVIQNLMKSVF